MSLLQILSCKRVREEEGERPRPRAETRSIEKVGDETNEEEKRIMLCVVWINQSWQAWTKRTAADYEISESSERNGDLDQVYEIGRGLPVRPGGPR